MTVYAALTVALIAVLALATTAAIYIGLFNGSAAPSWCGVPHVTI